MSIISVRRVALAILPSLMAFLFLVGADRLAAVFMADEGLIFPPRAIAHYATPEFDFQVRVNNLGFRGKDFAPQKRKGYRVVALGDSFTFGWGNPIQDTWPQILEHNLQKRGIEVEVANLGRPGLYPAHYAQIAEKAVPLLEPDLVVVAVTQGDDLAQTMAAAAARRNRTLAQAAWTNIKVGLKNTFPHFLKLSGIAQAALPEGFEAAAAFRKQMADEIPRLSPPERARLDRIDPEIRAMFSKGELNPAMLFDALRRPDEIRRTLDLTDTSVREGIAMMASEFRKIKTIAESFGGKTVVVSLPNGLFAAPAFLKISARLGTDIDDGFLSARAMDDAIRLAASEAGTDFVEITQVFREEEKKRELFYVFDGHYNGAGQRLFAESIEQFVRETLGRRTR